MKHHMVWRKWLDVLTGLINVTKRMQYSWAVLEKEVASVRTSLLMSMMPVDLAKMMAKAIAAKWRNPLTCDHAKYRHYGNATGSYRHCLDCDSV